MDLNRFKCVLSSFNSIGRDQGHYFSPEGWNWRWFMAITLNICLSIKIRIADKTGILCEWSTKKPSLFKLGFLVDHN